MSEDNIMKFELDPNRLPTLTLEQRARLEAMTDDDIHAAALADPDNPPLTEEELRQFERIPDIKAIREKLHLTQKQFADTFGISLSNVRDWEQGRSFPDQAARTLLKVIATNPEVVKQARGETMSSKNQVLSADRPITNPTDDRFGYAPFARHLAESICKMNSTEGLVIAVYGPWGSGKTSVLNLMRYYIEQHPQAQQPIVISFNPWWFSGHEDLTRRFFDQLQAQISGRRAALKKIRNGLANLADIVSNAPIPYASSAKVAGEMIKERQKDVTLIKEKISESLKEEERLFLIFIDDIDRLSSEDIRQLFRIIKAIADFPNVIYFLSFDKAIAVKALEKLQDISGEDYLEKIVQVPFELPFPDKTLLRRLLFEKLNAVLIDSPQELFDQTHWGNVYFDGIDHFIETPRDIVRLTNTLSVTYPAVKGEVNPVDFIGIETLRVFSPIAYDTIRRNIERFAGHSDTMGTFGADRKADIQAFHEAWITQVRETDKESVRKLLLRLFPKLESFWGTPRTNYGVEWEFTWRKQLRVCSPDIAPTYFCFAIPEGSISRADMQTVLGLINDARALGARLVEFASQKCSDGTTYVRTFLERFLDYAEEEIAIDSIPSIVQALFEVGDQLLLPEDESRGMFDSGNDIRLGRILWRLLPRVDETQRFAALKEAISQGKAVTTIVHEVAVFGQQHGKYGAREPKPDEQRLLNEQHLRELEELALQKIRDAAQQGVLPHAPRLLGTLYRWRDWANEEEVKQWMQGIISDDKGLAILLEHCLQKSFSHSISDRVGRIELRLDPQWFEPFLEPAKIVARVHNLVTNSELTENQRIAANQFIEEYELRERGENPESPLSRLSHRRK
jgi:predicted KAP-like P-loop ATPase/DNA-binding transcriptional regulator YiaG